METTTIPLNDFPHAREETQGENQQLAEHHGQEFSLPAADELDPSTGDGVQEVTLEGEDLYNLEPGYKKDTKIPRMGGEADLESHRTHHSTQQGSPLQPVPEQQVYREIWQQRNEFNVDNKNHIPPTTNVVRHRHVSKCVCGAEMSVGHGESSVTGPQDFMTQERQIRSA